MRVIFMGTPEFSVPTLRKLHDAHDVVAVYTRPDAASGRGGRLHPSAVKREAEGLGIPVRQPSTLRDVEVVRLLALLAPDVIVVAAYGVILPPAVLSVPPLGCINVHASLLPRWRGAAPVQRAILAGDAETGVSIMRMEEGLDTGPYCATAQVEVSDKDATTLTAELAEAGASLVADQLDEIAAGRCVWIDQNDAEATYADKINKADVSLSPELSAAAFVRRVRASSPAAPARAVVGGRGMTVLAGGPGAGAGLSPGEVACDSGALRLGVSDGCVDITRVRPDGKAGMEASAWCRGLRLHEDDRWESAR